jgi:hypothetical protein
VTDFRVDLLDEHGTVVASGPAGSVAFTPGGLTVTGVRVTDAQGATVYEGPVEGPVTPPPETFTCPRCHRTSWNPNDAREGYCGACHDWTRAPEVLTYP